MTAISRLLRRCAVFAAALAVELGALAALLDHLLQHFGDERVVVLGSAAGARLDVAVLDRRGTPCAASPLFPCRRLSSPRWSRP